MTRINQHRTRRTDNPFPSPEHRERWWAAAVARAQRVKAGWEPPLVEERTGRGRLPPIEYWTTKSVDDRWHVGYIRPTDGMFVSYLRVQSEESGRTFIASLGKGGR